MKKVLSVLFVLVFSAALITPAAAQGNPAPTISFTNPPASGLLVLGVGESYTFEVQVASAEPFVHAQLALGQFYPGRSVFADGIQIVHQGTSGTLRLTVTGKVSTAQLPDGVAPMTLVAGVRYQGGVVVVQNYEFGIIIQ
jgi:hypothetical protein